MPELPEVEVTRLGIAPAIEGQTLRQLILGKPLRWPLGCDPQALAGRRVAAVTRRGKYLLIHLRAGVDEAGDDAEGGVLLLHLGMSGSVRLLERDGPHGPVPARGPHEHMDMVLDRHVLRLHDPRRFGALVYAPSVQDAAAQKLLARLGLEPLSAEFTPEALAQGLRGRRTPIKQALLAGDVVVGVGNIYASEALFLAGIHPAPRAVAACAISWPSMAATGTSNWPRVCMAAAASRACNAAAPCARSPRASAAPTIARAASVRKLQIIINSTLGISCRNMCILFLLIGNFAEFSWP